MKVLKFGGSSVANSERIREVKKIIGSEPLPVVIVFSALQGVTDTLKSLSELAAGHDPGYRTRLDELILRHRTICSELLSGDLLEATLSRIEDIFGELSETLSGLFLLRELSRFSLDKALSAGERASSAIISAFLENSILLDSREIIRTDNNFGNANVDFTVTNPLIRKKILRKNKVIIVPGFIAATEANETTTLGRGGSDYTAAIIAAAINADMLEIWTDTDGFMTADPRKVEKAYAIESLSYSEAIELSHFGAKVIYTPTLRPVYKKTIPVRILNSYNPGAKGTLISNKPSNGSRSPIKGISSIDHIDLITLQGPSMVGISGTSMRLFGSLAKRNVSIVLITQASSEYSITFAVNPPDSKKAVEAINQEFEREINFRKELKILIEKDLSIIAIVGERMKNTPGISAILFRSLGRNGINVIATAQGSSELNISVVIKNDNLRKALNVIHDGFFLSKYKELHLFIAGTGLVGSSLVKQLLKQRQTLLKEYNLNINLLGLINSRKMLIPGKPITLEKCREALETDGERSDINAFMAQMTKLNLRNSVFVDCTANAVVAQTYGSALEKYVSVVTASKIACASDFSYYHMLKTMANERGVRFMYETTVGAGLPIIKTINDLVVSGDKILKIEAVLSGTLNFIFNTLGPDMPLSKTIRMAKDLGYSEPDPRIDLSGVDVVRKILILSREAGYSLEMKDVKVKNFLPAECFAGDLASFYEKVREFDDEFEKQRQELVRQNRKWRFFATMDGGKAEVGLISVDSTHPTFNLEGSNNIVLLTTERYRELPMVIKGYGAGADVTAAGVFADIMRVVNV
ncbi:MAG: bifunctional aspartate kinase/homoserine dehydrogenase I [Bacteroidales bacterium]|jgi:aspartokinase/homoserine dehydrogenase 1|nr:bifunctional aspartate kinase/homoserine dehydrogenase I [Bacteroidales bacterium]